MSDMSPVSTARVAQSGAPAMMNAAGVRLLLLLCMLSATSPFHIAPSASHRPCLAGSLAGRSVPKLRGLPVCPMALRAAEAQTHRHSRGFVCCLPQGNSKQATLNIEAESPTHSSSSIRGVVTARSSKQKVSEDKDAELEGGIPPPPPRSLEKAGYTSDSQTWPDFQYTAPGERREVVRQFARKVRPFRGNPDSEDATARRLPPLKIVLIGGPCSGKGTIAPMLSQAFRTRVVGVGQLLRGELRARTERGKMAASKMSRGELLSDDFIVDLVSDCIEGSWDFVQNGWVLDGFPRTAVQASEMLNEGSKLRPDCVVVLDRPDELIKEFSLGRMTDSATGQTFHPVYAPPPEDVTSRLVWRLDDTPDGITQRIADYRTAVDGILKQFEKDNIPIQIFDNARSELESFQDIASFVEEVGRDKLARMGGTAGLKRILEPQAAQVVEEETSDIDVICDPDDPEGECLIRWEEEKETLSSQQDLKEDSLGDLQAAVRRCNTYDPHDFFPVFVEKAEVGFVSKNFLDDLLPYSAAGRAVHIFEHDGKMAVSLAPGAEGRKARTEVVGALVHDLVTDGVIAQKSLRDELQDVRPIASGFRGGKDAAPPLLWMERAAMIYFGVPSFGAHVNGYVAGADGRPTHIWIGKRSMSKATYPGLLDQMVAGGQPAGLTFMENVKKECEEEGSLPPDVVDKVRPAGLVSYRYRTRKGLSTKFLAVFDVPVPAGMTPINGDGEVEEFSLLTVEDAIDTIRHSLPSWKPNSALVMIDFAMRHGFLSPDEPGFSEMAHLLRAGVTVDDLR